MSEYTIDINRLNEKGFSYLQEVFPDFAGEDFDYLYAWLSYQEDAEINLVNYGFVSDFSSTVIRVMNDVNEDYNNLTLNYKEEAPARRVIMDISLLNLKGHDYIKELFDFPEHYGRNLDALYDCLSEMETTEIIIINMNDVNRRSLKILSVFDEAAEDFGNIIMTYAEEPHV